jgi:iron complex transport system substrate-binding protein
MRFLTILFFSLAIAAPSMARTVTDHDGHTVEVPDNPVRIVSLHDWTLTVMARELGSSLIASTGRLAPDGTHFMRGARELFDLDFSEIELASVHGKPDLERIRALKPDLILANSGDYSALHDQLSTIAPTLMFNPENGRPAFDLYREFSGWLGKRNRFDELERAYRDKLTMAREQLSKSEQKPVYAAILTNGRDGTLTILKEYGPLTTALDDLGFARAPIVATLNETEGRMTVGAELIGELDVDYIFTSYLPEQGQNSQSIYDDLDRIAPGYREFLKSYQNGHIVSLSRYEVYPPSFKGLDLVIDAMSGLFTLNDSP